jgi:hypothetical protein
LKGGEIVDELIEALQILRKYGNPKYPTHCEHDELTVCINPELVREEDIKKLDELGFIADKEEECFLSLRYGSC